jgi:hypothetical protein
VVYEAGANLLSVEGESAWSIEAVFAETRAAVGHLTDDLTDFKAETRHDIRRIDDRLLHVLLIQLATLATPLGSLIAGLIAATH